MASDVDVQTQRLVQAGDYAAALELLDRTDPTGQHASLALRRVNCLRALGRWHEALNAADSAQDRHPSVAAIAEQRTRLTILLGRIDGAKVARAQAAHLLPRDTLSELDRLLDLRTRAKALFAPLMTVYDALNHALNARKPFALVRLGDGEGLVLSHDGGNPSEALRTKLHVWFGSQVVSPDALTEVRGGLRKAIAAADVIGAPRYQQLATRKEFVAAFEAAERERELRDVQVSESDLHHYFQFAGVYSQLLQGRRFLGIIGPRDLRDALSRRFGIGRVDWYPISAEHDYPGPVTGPHYPDQYAAVRDRLTVPEPGALFLVGAGVLGKVYCAWIRELGGVAIDVGSVLDGWAGVASRRRVAWAPDLLGLPGLAGPSGVAADPCARVRHALDSFKIISDVV